MEITPAQIRAGRALLGLTQADLAEKADVGIATVKRCEDGTKIRPAPREAIVDALRKNGIVFIVEPLKIGRHVVEIGVASRRIRSKVVNAPKKT